MLEFEKDGIEIRKNFLSSEYIEFVKSDIDLENKKLELYGIRNLEKKFISISKLVQDEDILSEAQNLLHDRVNLVRALFFDKTPAKNWLVSWHQDKTVTLNKRVEMPGWSAWSLKEGVHHVQPPVSVLDNMVTFRLHMDDADNDNGCLRVIPGTHILGVLNQEEIDDLVKNKKPVSCIVEAGDVVIMRPHLLHASSKARVPSHRRVVHIEYSSYKLPDGVIWA